MGIVKISDSLHDSARIASAALSRSINAQAEHWMRIGMLVELQPELRYSDICRLLLTNAQRGADSAAEQPAPRPAATANGTGLAAAAPGSAPA